MKTIQLKTSEQIKNKFGGFFKTKQMAILKNRTENKINARIIYLKNKVDNSFKKRHNSLDSLKFDQKIIGIKFWINELRTWLEIEKKSK